MPLTAEQMEYADGARRLLNENVFIQTLDRLAADSSELAILSEDPTERERHRQAVLAIGRVRNTLQAAVDLVKLMKDEEKMAKAFE